MGHLVNFVFSLVVGGIILAGCGATTLNVQSNPSGADVRLLKSGKTTLTDSQVKLEDGFFAPEFQSRFRVDDLKNSVGLSESDLEKLANNIDQKYQRSSETLLFEKEGYRSRFEFVNLKKGEEHSITSSLEPINTAITIDTDPTGGMVTLNLSESDLPVKWKKTFKTPITFEATSQEAKELVEKGLTIEDATMEGYFALKKWNAQLLEVGEKKSVIIPFKPIVTTIRIMTEPEGASVEDLTEGGFGYMGETPIVKNFNWEDVMLWAERTDVTRSKNRSFDALDLNIRISKPGHKDIYMQNLKVPVGEERVFKRGLKQLMKTIKFSSDPEGAHVYVKREVLQEYYNEVEKKMSTRIVEHEKHLGSTPFSYNMELAEPIKHGEILIFKKSGYEHEMIQFAEGEGNYHVVLEPKVIKAR